MKHLPCTAIAIFEHCKAQLYSISKDGLNEAGIKKMTVYYEKFS